MGGAEIGAIGPNEGQDIGTLLMINRELALEDAHARAERVIFGFRKARVFEKTFDKKLRAYNSLRGFDQIAEGGFVPVGYHDPHVDLSKPSNETQTQAAV